MQYWPPSLDKEEVYGDIHVAVLKEEELANFHIRDIRLYKNDENNVSIKYEMRLYCREFIQNEIV